MMTAREAWQIMRGARHETVADDAPEWQEFKIEYLKRIGATTNHQKG